MIMTPFFNLKGRVPGWGQLHAQEIPFVSKEHVSTIGNASTGVAQWSVCSGTSKQNNPDDNN